MFSIQAISLNIASTMTLIGRTSSNTGIPIGLDNLPGCSIERVVFCLSVNTIGNMFYTTNMDAIINCRALRATQVSCSMEKYDCFNRNLTLMCFTKVSCKPSPCFKVMRGNSSNFKWEKKGRRRRSFSGAPTSIPSGVPYPVPHPTFGMHRRVRRFDKRTLWWRRRSAMRCGRGNRRIPITKRCWR